jgi:hypothetical protein
VLALQLSRNTGQAGRPPDARYLANSLTVVQLALMTNLEDRFGAGERQRALLHAAEGVRRGRLRRWSCCWVCNRWMRVLSGVVDLGRSSGAVSIRVAVGVPAGEFGPAAPTTPGRCAGMQSARGAAPHVPERKWPARSSRARSASTHHRGSRSGAGWQSASDSMRGPPAILTPTVASADPPPAPGSRAHPGRSTHRTAGPAHTRAAGLWRRAC